MLDDLEPLTVRRHVQNHCLSDSGDHDKRQGWRRFLMTELLMALIYGVIAMFWGIFLTSMFRRR